MLLSCQMSVWPQKPIFYLGLALNLNFALNPIHNMITMARMEGTAIQVVEPYLMFCSHSGACFLWTIGLIVFLSDAPFIDERITHVVLRTGRKIWTCAQLMYIAATAVVYGLIPLLSSILFSLPYGYAGNVWSVMLFRIAENSGGVAAQLGLTFPNVQMLTFFTPYQFLAISMALQTLYCLALGMIVFCFNLIWRKSVGTVVALCAHNLGYFIFAPSVTSTIIVLVSDFRPYALHARGHIACVCLRPIPGCQTLDRLPLPYNGRRDCHTAPMRSCFLCRCAWR